jgi:FkbM family methyltransferase
MNAHIEDSLITLKAAICSESGTITLYASKNERFPTGASMLRTNCETVRYQVPALSFADFFSQYSLDEVSLLKLDCEGAEYDILYNCNQADLEKVFNIAIEVHRGAGDQENIEALSFFLKKTGFSCCVATDRKFIWASRDANKLVRRTS